LEGRARNAGSSRSKRAGSKAAKVRDFQCVCHAPAVLADEEKNFN
jgi:hypothetical protein